MGDAPLANAGRASGTGADQLADQKVLGMTLSQQADICKGQGQCQKHVSRPQNQNAAERLRKHCGNIGSQYSTPDLSTATLSYLRKGLDGGYFTNRDLVKAYMARIDEANDKLHADIETNPRAIAEASQLDDMRKAKSTARNTDSPEGQRRYKQA